MVFQSYHECFILLKSCAMHRLSVYTVSKRRKRKKERNPHAFSWFKFYSGMEGRILWCKHSARLEFKEIEGTRSSLLQPPPRGIPRVGRRRRKQNRNKRTGRPCPVSAAPGSPATHFPRPFLLLLQEAMVSAKSATMATVMLSSLCLIQAPFLLPSQEILMHRLLLPGIAFCCSQCGEHKETPVPAFSSPNPAKQTLLHVVLLKQ